MTIIEQITQGLLLWLTVMSADPVPIDVWSQPENLPSVYVVPLTELQEVVCGCECGIAGMYLGGDDHRIVIGGDQNGNLYRAIWADAIHLHELDHYLLFLAHEKLGTPVLSRVDGEKRAYTMQNEFLVLNGEFPLDIDKMTDNSTNTAYGKTECSDGTSAKPPRAYKLRKLLEPVIFKHKSNRTLREIYEARSDRR